MTKDTKTVGTLQEIGAQVGDVVEFVRPCEGFEFYEEKWVGRKLTMDEEGLKTENGTYGFCNDCVHEFRIVSRATPNYLDGSWHDWHGGECPVPGDVMVEVQLADDPNHEEPDRAGDYDWVGGKGWSITRFRVVQSNAEAPNSPVGGEVGMEDVHVALGAQMGVYGRRVRSEVIDIYDVLTAWNVTNAAVAHAIKKALQPGQRGHKDTITDLREAMASLQRAIEIEEQAR